MGVLHKMKRALIIQGHNDSYWRLMDPAEGAVSQGVGNLFHKLGIPRTHFVQYTVQYTVYSIEF